MNALPARDGKRIGALPILVHKVELVPHQKQSHDQLHLQLGDLHTRARVPTGPPTKEWIGGVRNWVRSQPPTGVPLVRLGVVFRVHVNSSQGIHKEIPPSDYPPGDLHVLTDVPSQGDRSVDNSLRLPEAGFDNRKFVFPRGDGDGSELLVEGCGGEGVVEVAGKQTLDLPFALLSPLWMNGKVDEHPAC